MMQRKLIVISIILVLSLVLAACSAVQAIIPAAATATPTPRPNGQGGFGGPGGPGGNTPLPLESKLSVGLLELESTALRVTPDEAKLLLPLWQQVQTLATDTHATNQQFQDLYKQVEADLSADQVKAIDNMKITFTDLQSLMTKYGVQIQGQFRRGSNNGNTLTPQEQATRQAQFGQGQGGSSGTLTPEQLATRRAQFANGQGGGRGANMIDEAFLPPLLQLLQNRATQ